MYNKVELCGVDTAQLPVLSEAEKRQLLTRARAGDAAARQAMIEGNLRLVLSVVQRFAQRGENLDDLFQVGCIGLIKAIDNFDPDKQVRFSTYGVPKIIREIRLFLRGCNALRVSREEPVFQKIGLKAKVDLFVGCVNGVPIYEAKAGKTKALDLYPLRMYVAGCALGNKPVDEAILIALYHPPEERELLAILNGLSAPDDRPYNFRLVTWDEEGIFVQQSA